MSFYQLGTCYCVVPPPLFFFSGSNSTQRRKNLKTSVVWFPLVQCSWFQRHQRMLHLKKSLGEELTTYQLPSRLCSQTQEKDFHLPPPDYPQALNLPTWLSVINGTGSLHLPEQDSCCFSKELRTWSRKRAEITENHIPFIFYTLIHTIFKYFSVQVMDLLCFTQNHPVCGMAEQKLKGSWKLGKFYMKQFIWYWYCLILCE